MGGKRDKREKPKEIRSLQDAIAQAVAARLEAEGKASTVAA